MGYEENWDFKQRPEGSFNYIMAAEVQLKKWG
jgi:hypothetical protein